MAKILPFKCIYPEYLDDIFEVVVPVGSRITCNPAPKDTDQDLLCFYVRFDDDWEEVLHSMGWTMGGEKYDKMQGDFYSFRKEEFNVIATCDTKFFDNFLLATQICKEKNLLSKKDRIAEFDKVFGVKKSVISKVKKALKSQPGVAPAHPYPDAPVHNPYGNNQQAMPQVYGIQYDVLPINIDAGAVLNLFNNPAQENQW